jgi:hypothetical protein
MSDTTALKRNFAWLVDRWDTIAPGLRDSEAGASEAGACEAGMTWLQDALDAAIKLEFSTIPPYLCALWSIKDQQSPVADSIRRIVQEEMLHMALACNMLVAIGGTPRIAEPDFAPVYPGQLAGGVHEGLKVGLSGLSDEVLRAFMIIELPEKPAQQETAELKRKSDIDFGSQGHETIGKFYDRLEAAFKALKPSLSTDRQISGPLSWFPVRNLDDVEEAIQLIKHQGEGSPTEPVETDNEVELAHFYRFLEIYLQRRIVYIDDSACWGLGDAMERPDCYPMAPVPAGGYRAEEVPDEAAALIDQFDTAYTRLLVQLGELWQYGDQGALVRAIETMFSLQQPARSLMQIPIKANPSATYGPCFRVKELPQ